MKKKQKITYEVKEPKTSYSRPSHIPTQEEKDQYYLQCWEAMKEKNNKDKSGGIA